MYTYNALITEVYDGDTVTAVIDLGLKISVTEKLRLLDIDAPELRGSSREDGVKARDYLRRLILGKEVVISTVKDKKGKYGRYLATISLEGMNVNQHLVDREYAVSKKY